MDRELPQKTRLRSHVRRALPGILMAIAASGGLVWAIGLLEPALERRNIRTARVERGPIEAVITGSGTVQPAAEHVLSSPIEARVLRILHPAGTVIEAGDALLELDLAAPTLGLEQLEGRMAQNAARREEIELELEEDLLDLESRLEIKGLDVEEMQYLLTQRRELFADGLVAESQLRQTETQVRRAQIELRTLGDAISKAREVAAARLTSLAAARRTLEQERKQARRNLEAATLRAEHAGVLTWILTEEGATVQRGEVVARIADLERFRVEAVVSEVHAGKLRPGQSVRLPVLEGSATQNGTILDGQIARILPEIESGTVRFWTELDQPDHPVLRANLRTDVLIVTTQKPEVLTLRKGPYVTGSGHARVFVIDGDVAIRREVRFGLVGYEHYEVLDGLEQGAEVIVSDVVDVLHLEQVSLR